MIGYMMVSDTGIDGPIVTIMDAVSYKADRIHHFNLRLFSKKTYEYFRTPRKLNSYILQLATGESIPLGILCIVATELADFNWFSLSHNYDTLGVPGVAIPIGELEAKLFNKI